MGSATNLYACPVCGKPIQFENEQVNHKVCSCGGVIARKGDMLQSLPIPLIQHADDYIQPGTEGVWNRLKFTITGRFRIWFEDTAYNYWTMVMADGAIKYLAEGYGIYAVYEKLDYCDYLVNAELKNFTFNRPLPLLNHGEVFLNRKNAGTRFDVEGSFHKPVSTETSIITYEAENDSVAIEIFRFDNDQIETYKIEVVEIDVFDLKNTRVASNAGTTFRCENCGHDNVIQKYPYVQSWACGNCGWRYSLKLSTLTEKEGKNDEEQPMHIPMGTVLKIKQVEFEVIGFANKVEASRPYGKWRQPDNSWNEYTLYSQKYGFAFLNETEGHWMLVREAGIHPGAQSAKASSFEFEGKEFELFLKYNFTIRYAKGSFPGNVFDEQEHTHAVDFIDPPYVWSAENHPKRGYTWFYGTYLERYEIRSQVKGMLPQKRGVAPGQPMFGGSMSYVVKATLVVILVLIGAFTLTGMNNAEKLVYDSEISLSDSATNTAVVTPTFTLKKWKSNLEFLISAPVENSWFELDATLVNAKTGDEYSLEQGVEYYHGVSDGESWSEGSTSETAYLSSIPAGDYFIRMNAVKDVNVLDAYYRLHSFHITVKNDTAMMRNFWLTFLIILIIPVLILIWQNYKEKSRWSVSPYTKYKD